MEGIIALLLANLIGGAVNPIFVRFGTEQIPPITFTAIRFAIATLIFAPIFLKQKKKIPLSELKGLIFNSVFFMLNVTLYAVGLQYTTIITSQILYTLVPLFVGIFAFFIFKEKITKHKIIGSFIALSGAIFILSESLNKSEKLSFGTPLGNIIVLGAVVSWSFYLSFSKKLTDKHGPITTTFFSFLTTLVVIGVLASFEFLSHPFAVNHLTSLTLGSIFGVGIISSGLLIFLYQLGINKTSSFIASLFSYFSPVFASLTAIPLAHEKITFQLIIGGILITGGVFYATSLDHFRKKAKSD